MMDYIMKIKKITRTNPVAKHSRNRSGAGAHKSKKDYSRKEKHKESVASMLDRRVLLEKQQNLTNSASNWFALEEERQKILEELDDVDF